MKLRRTKHGANFIVPFFGPPCMHNILYDSICPNSSTPTCLWSVFEQRKSRSPGLRLYSAQNVVADLVAVMEIWQFQIDRQYFRVPVSPQRRWKKKQWRTQSLESEFEAETMRFGRLVICCISPNCHSEILFHSSPGNFAISLRARWLLIKYKFLTNALYSSVKNHFKGFLLLFVSRKSAASDYRQYQKLLQ